MGLHKFVAELRVDRVILNELAPNRQRVAVRRRRLGLAPHLDLKFGEQDEAGPE